MSLRIIYMGTPDFAVPPLEALAASGHSVVAVVSQPDRPAGRKRTIDPTPVRKAAERLGLRTAQPEKIRTAEYLAWLADLKPDLYVTAAYGRILTPAILGIPAQGCINIHASLLPKYRGASPINAAIIHGETVTGITMMLTDEGMDTGDILTQDTMEIPDDADAGEMSRRLSLLAADRIVPVVEAWTSGSVTPIPQNHNEATNTRPMTRDDGRIDWSRPALEVHNLVRGTTPWPGSYTLLGGKRVKIHRTQVSSCPAEPAGTDGIRPGTVVSTCPDCIRVACGAGTCIELLSLQAEACRRLDARECFHNFRPGTVFGEG